MPTSKPNILFIMSDQHNAGVAGFAGDNVASTPHLDRLAHQGTTFSSAYCTSPICVPARASVATGRYVHDIGAWDNAAPYVGEHPSWGHALAEAGYQVTTIGKLHYRNVTDNTGFPDQRLAMHIAGRGDIFGVAQRPQGRVPTVPGFRAILDAGPGETDYTRYDRSVVECAVQFLEDASNERPWALMVSFVAPHFPLIAPQRYFDRYSETEFDIGPDTLGAWDHPAVHVFRKSFGIDRQFTNDEKHRAIQAYYGLCSFMDANVGAVLNALERSDHFDDTVVIYTSDHGESAGAHGLWLKHLLNEESVRIPLLLAGPGFEPRQIDSPVSHVDLMPTMLSLGQCDFGDAVRLAGVSLLDHSLPATADRTVFAEYHANGSAAASYMVRYGHLKYIEYIGQPSQLFDLDADPGEMIDLAQDPNMSDLVDEAAARLRTICDPAVVDALAKSDQARRVDEVGGIDAAASHTVAYTPVPGAE